MDRKLKFFPNRFVFLVKPVMIITMWVPDTLENGTESSAVLDCVYNYTEQVNTKHLTIMLCQFDFYQYSTIIFARTNNFFCVSMKLVWVSGQVELGGEMVLEAWIAPNLPMASSKSAPGVGIGILLVFVFVFVFVFVLVLV